MITLGELVKVSVCEIFQIVAPGHDWDDFIEADDDSPFLIPFYDCPVERISTGDSLTGRHYAQALRVGLQRIVYDKAPTQTGK